MLGWRSNDYPDFYLYKPYRLTDVYRDLIAAGTRDTFITDTLADSDPRSGAIKYDIGTLDSCLKPSPFNENPHATIFLTARPDTCAKIGNLTWTPYSFTSNGVHFGWQKVRWYYIFKRLNSGPYLLLDSVADSVLKYADQINLGDTVHYFIRAIKDTITTVTTSSNVATFDTRYRKDPVSVYLSNVTVEPVANLSVLISVTLKASDEWSRLDVYSSQDANTYLKEGSITFQPAPPNPTFISNKNASESRYFYRVHAFDLCGTETSMTSVSATILLRVTSAESGNKLSWSRYFDWDSGVEKYLIFKGTNSNTSVVQYRVLDSVSASDSFYVDTTALQPVGNHGTCYYIVAIQNPGSPHSTQETSFSNHVCLIAPLTIYVPNAFTPFGANPSFRPEGLSIDYAASSMEIFDRWGGRVRSISDITNGWDGKNSMGQYETQGIFFYKITIKGTDGKIQIKTGTVTLLD
jgi:gliding motility-associated-like protein